MGLEFENNELAQEFIEKAKILEESMELWGLFLYGCSVVDET